VRHELTVSCYTLLLLRAFSPLLYQLSQLRTIKTSPFSSPFSHFFPSSSPTPDRPIYLQGGSKRKETFWDALQGAWALLTQKIGSVRVDFAQPFSLQVCRCTIPTFELALFLFSSPPPSLLIFLLPSPPPFSPLLPLISPSSLPPSLFLLSPPYLPPPV